MFTLRRKLVKRSVLSRLLNPLRIKLKLRFELRVGEIRDDNVKLAPTCLTLELDEKSPDTLLLPVTDNAVRLDVNRFVVNAFLTPCIPIFA